MGERSSKRSSGKESTWLFWSTRPFRWRPRDVAPSRLFVAKALVRRMVRALPGNRVGLVQAEGTGVVLAPLTLDGGVLDLLLDTVEPGSLPTPGTELAPGLETALRLFGEESEKHRVLVVLSDGEDHGGGVNERIALLKRERSHRPRPRRSGRPRVPACRFPARRASSATPRAIW